MCSLDDWFSLSFERKRKNNRNTAERNDEWNIHLAPWPAWKKPFFCSKAIHWQTVYAMFEHTLIERWADKLNFHYCGERERVETRTTSVRLSCDSRLVIAVARQHMKTWHLCIYRFKSKLNGRINPTRYRMANFGESHRRLAMTTGTRSIDVCWMCATCDGADIWHYSFNLMYEMIKWCWNGEWVRVWALHRCHHQPLDVCMHENPSIFYDENAIYTITCRRRRRAHSLNVS